MARSGQRTMIRAQRSSAVRSGAVISTNPTAFAMNDGAVSKSGGGVQPISVPGAGTGMWLGTGRAFKVSASGSYVGAADDDLTITLYQVPAASLPIADTLAGQQTFTNWHSLGASTSRVIDGAKGSFSYDAVYQLSASGELEGSYTAEIAHLLDSVAAASAVASLAEADLNFAVVATLAVGGALTVINLNELRIDAV